MIAVDEQLTPSDLHRLAALHRTSIPDSLLSYLGPRFLASFYRFLAGSPVDHLFISRIEGRIVSACVLSFEPGSLSGRTLRATFFPMAWHMAVASIRDGAFRSLLAKLVTSPRLSEGEAHAGPEITHIYTDPEQRGRSLGATLIERVDGFLAGRGVEAYYVRTLDDPRNRAIPFYGRHGFERVGRSSEAGRFFVVFRKILPAGTDA